jgi:hypothetical protein
MPQPKDKDQTSDPAVIAMLTEEMGRSLSQGLWVRWEIEAPVAAMNKLTDREGHSKHAIVEPVSAGNK